MAAEKESTSALNLLLELSDHEADSISSVWAAIERADLGTALIEVEFLSRCHATRARLLKAQAAAEARRKMVAEPPMVVSREVN